MTNEQLKYQLKTQIEQGDCFNKHVWQILIDFKNAGGEQESAKQILEQLAAHYANNETLQDRTHDILDMVTGWCNHKMRVWDQKVK